MAEYISFQPSDYFATKLYTGNASTQVISSIGFNPAMTWIKERDGANNHALFDIVRGDDKHMEPNLANAEATESGALAFGTDQFTLGNWTPINGSGNLTVAWNWKAGTTTGIAGSPSITPASYSFNQTSGFSILKYEGSGATATLPHGLGVAPDMIITKEIEAPGGGNDWGVYHKAMGNTKAAWLNTTAAPGTSSTYWNDTSPTSTLFTVSTNTQSNGSSTDYIAYCFASKKGYSKFGSYEGNGSADGAFINTGFRPAFLIVKRYSTTGQWMIYDDKRLGYNEKNYDFQTANANAERTTGPYLDILSNGFKLRNTDTDFNGDGNTILYMAFAAFPLVSSNDIPTVAR